MPGHALFTNDKHNVCWGDSFCKSYSYTGKSSWNILRHQTIYSFGLKSGFKLGEK